MTSFVEKLLAEIVVNVCIGAVLGLMSGASWMRDDAVRQNRRVRRSEALNAEGEPDQVRTRGEHQ